MTHLEEAQAMAWAQQPAPPNTSREALARLAETVQRGLEAFDGDRLLQAQSLLEDSLSQVLVALKSLGIEAEPGLKRALARLLVQPGQRAFHVFEDRVEIWADGECRGTWPLYTEEDYRNVSKLALELGCPLIHQEARQLELFR